MSLYDDLSRQIKSLEEQLLHSQQFSYNQIQNKATLLLRLRTQKAEIEKRPYVSPEEKQCPPTCPQLTRHNKWCKLFMVQLMSGRRCASCREI